MRHNKVLKQNETTSGKALSPACGTVTVACGFWKYGCGSRPGYLFEHPKDYVTTSVALCHDICVPSPIQFMDTVVWQTEVQSPFQTETKRRVYLDSLQTLSHRTWHGCSASLESRTSLHGVPLPLSRRKPPEHWNSTPVQGNEVVAKEWMNLTWHNIRIIRSLGCRFLNQKNCQT